MHEIYFVHDQQESPAPRKRFLELSGFRVTLFESGTELLTALSEHKPDLILMDVLLPGPHGFDVCRLIRHQYDAAELPVILTSDVYRSRAYRDEASACGAQAYLLRPIDLADLVAETAKAIEVAHGATTPPRA
ncbi:MAG: response regulator [Planctomycetes bacterium]|nr:response regulator [Planctomycetota bacterium]